MAGLILLVAPLVISARPPEFNHANHLLDNANVA